jgi:hypothetical protein
MAARARASVLRVVGLGPNGRPELGPVVSGEYLNERTNEVVKKEQRRQKVFTNRENRTKADFSHTGQSNLSPLHQRPITSE